MKKSVAWKRVVGPFLSVALHIAAVVVLLHTLGFASKPKPEEMSIIYNHPEDLVLDDVVPIDPPESTSEIHPNPDPISTEELTKMTPPDDVEVRVTDDSLDMLDNLSPLHIQGVGADLSSQGKLTSRYGDRALRNGLLGSYFNRIDFTGETFMRIDETLNHQWELESAWPDKVRPDLFSIIWTGRIVPPRTGEYTFYLMSDDGARLWIDGQLMLDQFVERSRQVDEVKVRLLVGKSYDIKYAYCDVFQHAVSRLEWSNEEAGIPRQLIPTEHLWADGASTRQMMAWNEEAKAGAGANYPHRSAMRNPAMVEGQPFSHIVGYQSLNGEGLARLQLEELSGDVSSFQKSGRIPASASLPALPATLEQERSEPKPSDDDVTISIM
jgi:hypothetical protein